MNRCRILLSMGLMALALVACDGDSPTEPASPAPLSGVWQTAMRNYVAGEDWSMVTLTLEQDASSLSGELMTRDGVRRSVAGTAPAPDGTAGFLEIRGLPGTTGSCLHLTLSIQTLEPGSFGGTVTGRCPGTVADPYAFRRR